MGCGRGGYRRTVTWTTAVAAVAGWAWLGPVAGAQDRVEPVVTPAIQVTKEVTPGRGFTNAHVLVHPKDRSVLVSAAADFTAQRCTVHVSLDGGRTWARSATDPIPPEYRACTRPAFGPFMSARFGPDGTLYYASTGSATATNQGPTDGYLARSTDLGTTWEFTVVRRSQERDFTKIDGTTVRAQERFNYVRMAVHPTDPDIVAVGYRVEAVDNPAAQVPTRSVATVSADGGRTFPPPIDTVEPSMPREQLAGSDAPALVITPEGSILAFTKERPRPGGPTLATQPTLPKPLGEPAQCQSVAANPDAPPPATNTVPESLPKVNEAGAGARLLMSKSTDGGRSWQARPIDDGGVVCIPCLTTPEAAVDPESGAIYVVFELSETGLPTPRDDRNIFVMRSTNGGDTWSERLRINDDRDPGRTPGYDQFFPGISVAPNGRVDVAWYDMRTDALYNPDGRGDTTRRHQTCWDVYASSSFDGGRTFSTNVRVSDRTMNQNSGFALNLAYDLRGPIGVASLDDVAYVVWPDSRSGSFNLPTEDTYMATMLFEEPTDDGGSPLDGASVLLGLAMGLAGGGAAIFLLSRRKAPAP